MNVIETTAEERAALFDRATDEAADPVTHHWRDEAAEARMTELIEAQYGLPRREAQLTAHEWYGNEIARRDLTVRMMLKSDEEQEAFARFMERLIPFWEQHPEIPTLPEAERTYRQVEKTMLYAVRRALLNDGDMQILWHDTGVSADFQRGLRSDNPLHWRVVARAIASAGIPGITAETLMQPNSLAHAVVLDVVDGAHEAAMERREEGRDANEEAVDELRAFAQAYAQHFPDRPVTVMEYPATRQRADLAEQATRKAYLRDVVYAGIVARLELASPDGTYDREEAGREMKAWLVAEEEREGKEASKKRLADQMFIEAVRDGRLAHTLTLEPDGYVAEWGAFGVGNREAETEGTVYEVLKG